LAGCIGGLQALIRKYRDCKSIEYLQHIQSKKTFIDLCLNCIHEFIETGDIKRYPYTHYPYEFCDEKGTFLIQWDEWNDNEKRYTPVPNKITYKGYTATITYELENDIFVGEVTDINDSLNFHGESTAELNKAFEDCIKDYFELCKQAGKEPQRPNSETFAANITVTPLMYDIIKEYAHKNNLTVDQIASKAIEMYMMNALRKESDYDD
jgi:predicted HicB family RNase H-like nuclease